jgi:hypothetical protein
MADEQWLWFEELVEIVRRRLNASVGRAEAVAKAALASREVRQDPRPRVISLRDDDGIVGMDLLPSLREQRPSLREQRFSKDDFLDWCDRHAPQQSDATEVTKHRYRYPGDAKLVKKGQKMVEGGMSVLQAAKKLAERAEGTTDAQKIDRLRKLIKKSTGSEK